MTYWDTEILIYHDSIQKIDTKAAEQYLIKVGLVDNGKDLLDLLLKHSNVSDMLQERTSRKLKGIFHEPALNYEFPKELLYILLEQGKFPFQHLDILDKKFTFYQDYSEGVCEFCSFHMLKQEIDQILYTCRLFNITEISELSEFYISDAIGQAISFISHVNCDEHEYHLLLKKLDWFKDFPEISFCREIKEKLDIVELSDIFSEIRYDRIYYYLPSQKEFVSTYEIEEGLFDIGIDGELLEDAIIISEEDVDQQQILEDFIEKADILEKDRLQLRDYLYERKIFQNCKQKFAQLHILHDFYAFQQEMYRLLAIGWCIEKDYQPSDTSVDWQIVM